MPYAMPNVLEALDRLSGKKYYSSFDFTSWFQQFEIAEEDRNKTAFIIPGDNISPPQIFQWKKMCFGLLNAGYWSQRQLQEALQEALEKFEGCTGIYPFVDDVVIASDTLEEHLEKLDAFMRFCKHHNIRVKREKVELVVGAVKHLGFILSEEGQALDPARVDSLMAIGAPSNLKGLKALLGSFGFIRGWLVFALCRPPSPQATKSYPSTRATPLAPAIFWGHLDGLTRFRRRSKLRKLGTIVK